MDRPFCSHQSTSRKIKIPKYEKLTFCSHINIKPGGLSSFSVRDKNERLNSLTSYFRELCKKKEQNAMVFYYRKMKFIAIADTTK